MILVLRSMPVGVTYAIWSGVGIVLVTIAGIALYDQIPDVPAVIGMAFIVIGVIVIHFFQNGWTLSI
jgi:small multidrug resistance pump